MASWAVEVAAAAFGGEFAVVAVAMAAAEAEMVLPEAMGDCH